MSPPAAAERTGANEVVLAARDVVKVFPGVRALDGVDLTLRAGEIHALMGENGAGKSTLIKVLTGVHTPEEGRIELRGQPILPRTPADARRLGIATVYQEINLVPTLSVAENLSLGRQPTRWGVIRWGELRRRAKASLDRLGLDLPVDRPLGSFPLAVQQLAAIARAIDLHASVLILDEPTSSLDADEVGRLFSVMRGLRERGLAILFVTHFVDQVYEIADRITVLRNGRRVDERRTDEMPRRALIDAMLGRAMPPGPQDEPDGRASTAAATEVGRERPPVLVARGLARRGAMQPFDLELHEGEVVGLAGLLGSGRTETARLLFGLDRPDRGELRLRGERVRRPSPRRSVRRGLALLPEDRQREGLFPHLSVRENIILALQAKRGWWRPLPRARRERIASDLIKALRIRTPNADRPIRLLSGGNQQKAILARCLATEPIVLILDEPTRGIDVGAKQEVERLVAEWRAKGLAILFISAELDEVARDADRVLVLRDRRIVAELGGEAATSERIVRAIAEADPS